MILRGKKKETAIKLHKLREQRKKIDQQIEEATNLLKTQLEHGNYKCGDYEVGFVEKERVGLDKKKLKEDLKSKFKKYETKQSYSVLYVTKKSA